MPVLSPEIKFGASNVTKKSLDSFFLGSSWRKAVLQARKLRNEYARAFGLEELKERVKMPHLPGLQSCQKSASLPRQPTGAQLPPASRSGESSASCLQVFSSPLCAGQSPGKEQPWQSPFRLKKTKEPGTAGPLWDRAKGSGFSDPLAGAPPRYLQRLSRLATLESNTIRQETAQKLNKGRHWGLGGCW